MLDQMASERLQFLMYDAETRKFRDSQDCKTSAAGKSFVDDQFPAAIKLEPGVELKSDAIDGVRRDKAGIGSTDKHAVNFTRRQSPTDEYTIIRCSLGSRAPFRADSGVNVFDGDALFISDTHGNTYPVPRVCRPWSFDENVRLKQLRQLGYHDRHLAENFHDRTTGECLVRLYVLSLLGELSTFPGGEANFSPHGSYDSRNFSSIFPPGLDNETFAANGSTCMFSTMRAVSPESRDMASASSHRGDENILEKEPTTPSSGLRSGHKRAAFQNAANALKNLSWCSNFDDVSGTKKPSSSRASILPRLQVPASLANSGSGVKRKRSNSPPRTETPPTAPPTPLQHMHDDSFAAFMAGNQGIVVSAKRQATTTTMKEIDKELEKRDNRIAELKTKIEMVQKMKAIKEKDREIRVLEDLSRQLAEDYADESSE